MRTARGRLGGCASDIENTPLAQHCLQLMLTLKILEKQTGIRVNRAIVVQVTDTEVVRYFLPPSFARRSNDFYADLVVAKKRGAKRKKT